jgi:hypothetical protein
MGKAADFDKYCGTESLDVRANDEKSERSWRDDCRRLRAKFLVNMLTKDPWRGQLEVAGIQLTGAWIEGDINLTKASLDREVRINQSRIEGKVVLDSAEADQISIVRSRFGTLSADQFHSKRTQPVVEIEPFKDVFHKKIDTMKGVEKLYFSALVFLGWFLALVFVAAVSGITQNK